MSDSVGGLSVAHSATIPTPSTSHCASSSGGSLKRSASPSFENNSQVAHKRMKEDLVGTAIAEDNKLVSTDSRLAEELASELECGCCSGLLYRPVTLSGCQHAFCGSCCVLWINNGGTTCPACRTASAIATPCRVLQTVLDTLLRFSPERTRTLAERQQADAVYTSGALRFPSPRVPSPEPAIGSNADFARPCPHCTRNNAYRWRCPNPIVDPTADIDNAWRLDNGMPPGHGQCAHCENLLALEAPSTSSCDLCKAPFCGVNIPGRCSALLLQSQHPQGLSNISDLIESADVYECFDGNNFEVDVVFDYLRTHDKTPRHIYREIVAYLLSQPTGFLPLLESDVFCEINGSGPENIPQGPYNRICRVCAYEVLIFGLRDWWVRERQKGFVDPSVLSRPDCAEGPGCQRQRETAHAKEFNHIVATPSVPTTVSIPVQEQSRGPIPLLTASSSSTDAVERMILPVTQAQSTTTSPPRSSALTHLLNADFEGAAALGQTVARDPFPSNPTIRDPPHSLF